MHPFPFWKYHGAGNDFILVDDPDEASLSERDAAGIARLCHRRFGIGADGLIILRPNEEHAFDMRYFNADGHPGSLCGNGARCAVALAHRLGRVGRRCRFLAADGPHEAIVSSPDWIEVRMGAVTSVERGGDQRYFLDTGSPHYVCFVPSLDAFDVVEAGRAIRYSERFRAEGTNVNFVEEREKGIAVATYERGVEDETLACGTGVTAAALAYYLESPQAERCAVEITAKGGRLAVRFAPGADGFDDIWLCGPARFVFTGRWAGEALENPDSTHG